MYRVSYSVPSIVQCAKYSVSSTELPKVAAAQGSSAGLMIRASGGM